MKIAQLNGKPEIFYSIQGEGKNMGKPSIFVRASLCNLHCFWCDTDYTWNWEGTRFPHQNDDTPGYEKFQMAEQIIEMPAGELIQAIRAFDCQHLVLTGGEPLMQLEAWVELMQLLRAIDRDYTFEVETNGTLRPSLPFDGLVNQYNVSPKLSNSGNQPKLRHKPQILRYFAENDKAVFKFVVARKRDLAEVLDLADQHAIPKERIYLMPEGRTPETLQKRRLWLVEACKKYGFHYTDRLHVQLYGDKRGV